MTTHEGRKYSAARNLRAQHLKSGDLVWIDEDRKSYRVVSARLEHGWLRTVFLGRPGVYLINPTKPLLVWIPEHNTLENAS